MRLIAEYPWLMISAAFFIGAAFALVRYWKISSKDYPRWLIPVLAICRGLAAFLLALLLFSPWIIRKTEQVKPPLLIFLQDNSGSMVQSSEGPRIKKDWPEVRKNFINDFKGDAQIRLHDFSDRIKDSLSGSYNGKSTALDEPFSEVLERYADANLGALVIMSDGIYNRGSHPLMEASKFRVPVYALLAGDTTPSSDLAVGALRNNEVVFIGNQFSVEMGLKEEGFGSPVATSLRIEEIKTEGNKTILKEQVKLSGYSKLVKNLTAESKGLHHYRIVLDGIKGERNLKNNQRDFYVEVVDTKSKILMWAQSPHPDLAAIRQALINNPQYEIETAFSYSDRPDFNKYSLIIAHNIPASQEQRAILQALLAEGKSIWFMGARTNFSLLNGLQGAFKALFNSSAIQYVNAQEAVGFTLFGMPASLQPLLQDLPPLEAPDLSYSRGNGLEIALKQLIGQVATPYPLWSFSASTSNGRLGFITGEGIWRWRMSVNEKNNSPEAFDELIRKSVQFLLVREDKRPLRVWHDKNLYESTEGIQFSGRLLNKSLEPVRDADIRLEVKSKTGVRYQFRLLPDNQGYSLDIVVLPQGSYQWNASTSIGKEVFKSEGNFEVKETDWEGLEITARHDVLRQIAQATGGKAVHWTQAENLVDSIRQSEMFKPVYVSETNSNPLSHWWPLLVLIGFLLSSEWLLARYYGLD